MEHTKSGAAVTAGTDKSVKKNLKKLLSQEQNNSSSSFFVSKKQAEKLIVKDLKECQKLWNEFSPHKTLFDTWEFRLAFQEAYKYEPYFIVLRQGGENKALLPLCYDHDNKRYIWFGTNWQEEVDFFAKEKKYVPQLIEAAPTPLELDAISPSIIEHMKAIKHVGEDDPKYKLNVANFAHHEDYLKSIRKGERRNLRKDRNRVEKLSPTIDFNKFKDLKHLIKLSEKRFAEKGEDTDWEDPRRVLAFKNVIKLSGKSYDARMISIRVGKKIAGVDLVCLYKGTYFAVKCGYDVKNFSGIGNYMNMFEIDDAIRLGMQNVDFLQSSYQWKNKLFQPTPLFKIRKI